MEEYLANGTQLGWLMDSYSQRVEVYRQGQAIEVLERPSQLSGESIIRGVGSPRLYPHLAPHLALGEGGWSPPLVHLIYIYIVSSAFPVVLDHRPEVRCFADQATIKDMVERQTAPVNLLFP
ncbi:MAG: Uma2 family endonuclease [Spirulina sp.]